MMGSDGFGCYWFSWFEFGMVGTNSFWLKGDDRVGRIGLLGFGNLGTFVESGFLDFKRLGILDFRVQLKVLDSGFWILKRFQLDLGIWIAVMGFRGLVLVIGGFLI